MCSSGWDGSHNMTSYNITVTEPQHDLKAQNHSVAPVAARAFLGELTQGHRAQQPATKRSPWDTHAQSCE